VELRAKAWRMAMERNGDWDSESTSLTDYVGNFRDGDDGTLTTDIEEFHERAVSLLRESGGRMNSLTFGYKWEQQYGESLHAFSRMQRLSVAEMLRQSNRFWVVDMQGGSAGGGGVGEADEPSSIPIQVFVLVDRAVEQSKGTRLGDQLSMHGESDALRQWKARRQTSTVRRSASVKPAVDVNSEVVGMPSEASVVGASRDQAPQTYASHVTVAASQSEDAIPAKQVACIQVPRRVATETRLSGLLDALEPSVSGVDSRLGIRQMHVAWSQNCSCAASAVDAMSALTLLQGQAKGRQVRRLEEQIRSFADVVQSGVNSLGGKQLAEVVRAVEGRMGFDNLIKYVANRLVQSDITVDAESKSMTPADVAKLVEAFSTSSQRDVALYRKLGGICMKMKPADFTVDDIALILEGFERAGLRDKSLIRHMGAIIQSGLAKDCTPRGIGSLASSLVAGGASEGAALRTLSALAQRIPASEYTAESLGIIWTAFAAAEIRDPPLYRFISSCIEAIDDSLFDANMVARIARAAAKSGMPANDPIYEKLVSASASLRCSAYTPDTASRIVSAFAAGSPQSEKLFKYFALVLKKMDAWTFDIDSVAMVVGAYKRAGHIDTSLFARLSTVLQQIDAVSFTLSSIATVANAYGDKGVVDKALLGRLAGILQQMDGKVVSGPEAVQDVSMILNAYARADMRETALSLSHTLTNHLKPHVGGLTAQAMANIVLRVGVA